MKVELTTLFWAKRRTEAPVDWRAKVELFEQMRRDYEHGEGAIRAAAIQLRHWKKRPKRPPARRPRSTPRSGHCIRYRSRLSIGTSGTSTNPRRCDAAKSLLLVRRLKTQQGDAQPIPERAVLFVHAPGELHTAIEIPLGPWLRNPLREKLRERDL